jgi:hypothetical protein
MKVNYNWFGCCRIKGKPPRRTIFVLTVLATVGFARLSFPDDAQIRPDDLLTPGAIASTDFADVCGIIDGLTYSKRHRRTSSELKRDVYETYHVDRAGRNFEIDHRVPLCLGGADVRENLWPQPGYEHPSYQEKDALEEEICRRVCRDHTLSLQEGQAIFLGDWIIGYQRIFQVSP